MPTKLALIPWSLGVDPSAVLQKRKKELGSEASTLAVKFSHPLVRDKRSG